MTVTVTAEYETPDERRFVASRPLPAGRRDRGDYIEAVRDLADAAARIAAADDRVVSELRFHHSKGPAAALRLECHGVAVRTLTKG